MFLVLFVILGSLKDSYSTDRIQTEIARILGINKERVYRTITHLSTKEIITKRIEGQKILGFGVLGRWEENNFSGV